MNDSPLAPRQFLRLATSAPISLRSADDRTIDYIFSDGSVARDGNTIATSGWEVDEFRANPVFLWAHDSSAPPIGRVTEIGAVGDQLRGTVKYPTRDEYPFADTIFRLVKGGFINATSVSWLPIEWRHATDKSRPGGIDFKRQALLEVSQVPVPALATALATARAAGIDTGPLFDWATRALDLGGFAVLPRLELETLRREAKMASGKSRAKKAEDWKVGAARDLPVEDKDAWDGPAAAGRMLDAAGFDGDKPDSAKARRGFLLYDAANPDLKGSYKEPFADVVDGKLTAIAGGIRAAASRLPDVDGASSEVKDEARKVLDAYEATLKDKASAEPRATLTKRSLWHVGWLAMILDDLGCVQNMSEYEAAIEEDGSTVPGQLLEAMKTLGGILVAMTIEEVNELVAGDDEDELDGGMEMASGPGLRRAAFRALRRLDDGALAAIFAAMHNHLRGARVSFSLDNAPFAPLVRAGRVLSAENERCLRDALELHDRACGMIRGVVEKNAPDDSDPEQGDGDDEARALRQRKAGALRLKHRAAAAP